MAKPIKETPVLKDADAKVFIEKMKKADDIRITDQERARIKENFARLQAIANF